MLDKKISVSEQVANLQPLGMLIFTWATPHADDLGLLPSSIRSLKALVVPMVDITLDEFGKHVGEIMEQGLWCEYTYKKEKYLRIVNFHKHQTLKKDRKPSTLLPGIESWGDLEDIGFHLEDIGIQMEDIGNPREEKGTEEKISKREVAKAPTPSFGEKIRNKDPEYAELVKELASKDFMSARQIHQVALDEFLPHWEEKGDNEKKARWQKQKSFNYLLRFRTWIKNKHEWAKDQRCREGTWHRKGDSCHCTKDEDPPPRPPIRQEARVIGAQMRVTDP